MPTLRIGNALVLVSEGDWLISVKGNLYTFEWANYVGPVALTKRGDPLAKQPNDFLEAASLWHQQGREVDEQGLCIYHFHHEQTPIVKHVSKRTGFVTGWTKPQPPTRGF